MLLAQRKPLLNPAWLPNAPVRGIVVHWTAGSHIASALDREHYHFLVEGDGDVVKGLHSLTKVAPPLVEGAYAAHTRGTNSYMAGVSLCSMANAIERPFSAGRSPTTKAQWDAMIQLNAELVHRYKFAISHRSVLTHAEVQTNLGNPQRGKWDIAILAFDPSFNTAKKVGDRMRAEIAALLK